jgi:gluconate 2-dehydrogenase gamma chain
MPFDRRHLLSQSAALSVTLACRPESSGGPKKPAEPVEKPPEKPEKPEPIGISGPVAATLAAVAARILPEDDLGPGADATAVGVYIERTLQDPRMKHLLPLLNRGAGFVNRAAKHEHGVGYFPALQPEQQDDLLRRMADGKMRPSRFKPDMFVRVMVALTLEGYLGDPNHGGNKDKLGWAAVGYDPAGRNALVHIDHKKGG